MGTYGPKPTSAPTGAIILHPGDNISALVSAAPTGTTFYFEPGVYRGVSLAPNDGQTFIGAQGAVLSGAEVLTDWTPTSNLWVIGGQTQQGTIHASEEFLPGTQRPGYPETVFLDNTPLKPVDALSKVVPGTFYFDYAADKIYIADNPTGHTIEAGKLTDAFHGSATNVTVQNLVIEKYDPQIQDGAIQGGQGWTIQNNEVRLNYAVGIIGVDGSKLIGNYVHDNGEMGLGGGGDNILVQGNEIAKNGYWSGIDVGWEGGGFKFADTDNLVVRGNYSHDNNGMGMWTDIDNIHTLYEDNVVVHNGRGGISHEISYQAIIRNNTLIGNGADNPDSWWWGNEIQIQNSQNVEVYGNRVEMTGGGNGIVLIQQDRGSGTFGTHTTTGNQIHDNIIVDHDGEGYIGGVADYNESGMLSGGNIWSNNQYFMSDGGDRFEWGGSETFTQFKGAAHETGSISQSYPDTSGWLTAPADATPSPPADPAPPPPADTSPPATPGVNTAIPGLVPTHNFDGDGKADILLQNDNGTPAIWTMDGTNITSGAFLANPGPTWHVEAAADFNGDGKSDILWQNDNGQPAIWTMDGTNITSGVGLANPGPTWHVEAAADFNGDGKSDILWQNDNGQPAIWTMDGTNITSGVALANPGPTWHVEAAADFNGDGKSDILWQNDNGQPAIWTMDGTNITSGAFLANPGPTWHVEAAADFNGDGKSDILWQNDNGQPAIWTMDGTNITSGVGLANPGPSWHVEAAADFNGDGKSDILWQNDNGTPAIWTMDGTNMTGGAALPNPGSDWHLF